MSTLRALCGIIGGCAAGVLIGLAIAHLLTHTIAGVCIAVVSAAVIGIELCRLVERDRRRMRKYREQVWERRDADAVINRRLRNPAPFWQLPPSPFDENDRARWRP